ncbi:LysE family translocator [Nocardia sp. NPDC058666]|uniref:LysE family translocator n=1 Tax=Nocardia sp. NPDC058666 TaxID=3346587 RepID=UPI00364FABD8
MIHTPDLFMPSLPIFLAFLGAALAMNLTPGLDTMFVIGQTMEGGVRAGVRGALGIATGSACHTVLAAVGISALVAASPVLLSVLTYAGAAYLVWIGVAMVRRPSAATLPVETGSSDAFRRGVLTNLLNVKVILFYLTFLPQFLRPSDGPEWQQVVFYGMTFNVLGTTLLLAVALISNKLVGALGSSDKPAIVASRVCGTALIALAIGLALTR